MNNSTWLSYLNLVPLTISDLVNGQSILTGTCNWFNFISLKNYQWLMYSLTNSSGHLGLQLLVMNLFERIGTCLNLYEPV